MIEMSAGKSPRPGPDRRRVGGRWHLCTEEERREADLAAVQHPIVAELARLCIVDFDDERADAAEIVRRLQDIQHIKLPTGDTGLRGPARQ
jgi:cell fate regulator YaaT (PSP1 superfamily)